MKVFTYLIIAIISMTCIFGVDGRPNGIPTDESLSDVDESLIEEMEQHQMSTNRIKFPFRPWLHRPTYSQRPYYGAYAAPPRGHYKSPIPFYYNRDMVSAMPYPALGANYIY